MIDFNGAFDGTQILALTVFIHIDEKEPYTLKSFEDTIQVKVSPWQTTKDVIRTINPVWAFAVGAIPALLGVYTWIRGKLPRPQTKTDWAPFSARTRSYRKNRPEPNDDR